MVKPAAAGDDPASRERLGEVAANYRAFERDNRAQEERYARAAARLWLPIPPETE